MDFSVRYWGSYRRAHPAPFPLLMLDYVSRKTHWIRHAFDTFNLSLILDGRGTYVHRDRRWAVEAPCVLTQPPGEYVEYGPLSAEHAWAELYLMYDARHFPEFRKLGLLDPARPVWPVQDLPLVGVRLNELRSVCAEPVPERAVDRVDRLCELLILETRLAPAADDGHPTGSGWATRVERELAGDLQRDLDLADLAGRWGMSPATFRRRWAESMNVPPGRYRAQARLRAACRLLAETALPIRQIAAMVGFRDELYFSRRFSKDLHLAPRDYRRAFHRAGARAE